MPLRESQRERERGREGERERGKPAAPAPADVKVFEFNQATQTENGGTLILNFVLFWLFFSPRCDATDPDSCNNEYAIKHFNNFQRALNVYSCADYR
jgi:hypothetical protein